MLDRQIRWLTKQVAGPDGTGFWQLELQRKKRERAELEKS